MRKVKPLAARFWEKVNKDGPVHPTLGTPCWLWTAQTDFNGYGRISRKRDDGNYQSAYAHRIAWELAGKTMPAGTELDHVCRVRHCVRADGHLEAVTHRENIRRSPIHFWALTLNKTHCHRGHAFSDENLIGDRKKGRHCRLCNRLDCAAYYVRRKARRAVKP